MKTIKILARVNKSDILSPVMNTVKKAIKRNAKREEIRSDLFLNLWKIMTDVKRIERYLVIKIPTTTLSLNGPVNLLLLAELYPKMSTPWKN